MGYPLFTNNAASGLVYPINSTQTTIYLNGGSGSLFPSPNNSNYFYLTLISALTGNMEIVKCTARSGDVLTVVRAQEGTTAQSFAIGDAAQLRVTAAGLQGISFFQATNFSLQEIGNKLYFYYNTTPIASIDSSGNFITLGTVTAVSTSATASPSP